MPHHKAWSNIQLLAICTSLKISVESIKVLQATRTTRYLRITYKSYQLLVFLFVKEAGQQLAPRCDKLHVTFRSIILPTTEATVGRESNSARCGVPCTLPRAAAPRSGREASGKSWGRSWTLIPSCHRHVTFRHYSSGFSQLPTKSNEVPKQKKIPYFFRVRSSDLGVKQQEN